MRIDRKAARQAFVDYVSAYDPQNPRIALKVAHTLRVSELAADIAGARGPGDANLAPHEVDLAWLMGLLHDIGRFEQVRRFDTFNDSASVPHAALGAQILFETDPALVRAFLADDECDTLIRDVVATHADFRLPPEMDERTRIFANIIRDADKLDIIHVNACCPIEDIYGVTEHELLSSTLTPEVVETFYAHRTVERGARRTPADIFVSHLCFVFELVYARSRMLAAASTDIRHMLERTFEDPATQKTFSRMADHLQGEMLTWR